MNLVDVIKTLTTSTNDIIAGRWNFISCRTVQTVGLKWAIPTDTAPNAVIRLYKTMEVMKGFPPLDRQTGEVASFLDDQLSILAIS